MKPIKYDPKNPNQDMTILPQSVWDCLERIFEESKKPELSFGGIPIIEWDKVPDGEIWFVNIPKGNWITNITGLNE